MIGEKVYYEVSVKMSNASMARTLLAMIDCKAELTDSFDMSSRGLTRRYCSVVMLLKMPLDKVVAFRVAVRPESLRYKSPTGFNDGSLIPRFDTPEEELAARKKARDDR